MSQIQNTIAAPASVSGIGLHSGTPVTCTLKPAEENSGITFIRTDLNEPIPARATAVTETMLQTVLANTNGAKISTVEHLMAALCASGIDNLIVEVNSTELPILDGSAAPWLALLKQTGKQAQSAPRRFLKVKETVEIIAGEKRARAEPSDKFTIDITVNYHHPQLPKMHGLFEVTEENFTQHIAPARTFILEKDIAAAKAAGLAKGGSLDNAVVYGEDGPLNPEGLRFADEALRHKTLDCIGDLFMHSQFPRGKFTFHYPGHALNNSLLKKTIEQ